MSNGPALGSLNGPGGVAKRVSTAVKWMQDDETVACCNPRCAVPFGLLIRRHHCRACGKIYCSQCCMKRSADPKKLCADCDPGAALAPKPAAERPGLSQPPPARSRSQSQPALSQSPPARSPTKPPKVEKGRCEREMSDAEWERRRQMVMNDELAVDADGRELGE